MFQQKLFGILISQTKNNFVLAKIIAKLNKLTYNQLTHDYIIDTFLFIDIFLYNLYYLFSHQSNRSYALNRFFIFSKIIKSNINRIKKIFIIFLIFK